MRNAPCQIDNLPEHEKNRVLKWVTAFKVDSYRVVFIEKYQLIILYADHADFDLDIHSNVGYKGLALGLTTKERDKKGRLYSTACYSYDGSDFVLQPCCFKPYICLISEALFCLDANKKSLAENFGFSPTKSEKAIIKERFASRLREAA